MLSCVDFVSPVYLRIEHKLFFIQENGDLISGACFEKLQIDFSFVIGKYL